MTFAQAGDHGRTDGDVGDEVAVHDVDVDGCAAAALGRGNLVGQVGKVGGEDGWQQLDHGMKRNSLRGQFIRGCGKREWLRGCGKRRQRQREHRDVVLLAELDRRIGDLLGRARTELARALEAKELAHGVARLDHTIG